MNELTDQQLVDLIKNDNCNESLKILVNRHSGIYSEIIRRYSSNSLTEYQKYELLQEKEYNFYKAALLFDGSKSQFHTYIGNTIRFICLNKRSSNRKELPSLEINDSSLILEDKANTPNESCEEDEIFSKIRSAIDSVLCDREKNIMKERYFSTTDGGKKPWNKIAEQFNLSIQGCINIHNKALPKLLKKIKNEQITF